MDEPLKFQPSDTKPSRRASRNDQPGQRLRVPRSLTQKQVLDAKLFAELIVDHPEYRKALFKAAIERTLPPGLETMLWHYAKGKPRESMDIHVQSNAVVQHQVTLVPLNLMSDAELQALRSVLGKAEAAGLLPEPQSGEQPEKPMADVIDVTPETP